MLLNFAGESYSLYFVRFGISSFFGIIVLLNFGGQYRGRTCDLLSANQALSQTELIAHTWAAGTYD